jgi:transcriptional regulator with XRE-family HTH domain
MDVNFSYRKLKGKIIEKFGSQDAFAKALGVSKQSVSKKMNGRTYFNQEDIITWSDLLGIELNEAGAYYFT